MTKKALTLSIVIPVYNDKDHLKACLYSIKSQTVEPDEVIVVDNNCSDGSMDVAKKFSFVKIIREKKQSVLYARTTGIEAAKSDIVGRIDADTLLDKTWVKNVKKIFEDQAVMAATGPMNFYDMPLSPGNRFVDHLFKGPLYKYTKKFPFLAGNNMAIRKNAWNKIKKELCEDKTMHEDLDIAIHLYKNNMKIAYDKRMVAGMSTRRYDDKPSSLRRYTKMTDNAFKKHNLKTIGVHVSGFAYTTGYFALWPLRRSYNPQTGRRNIKQFMVGNKPRKNPMD
jgi:glycosyltransferase involved in cell wall biosynthesis